MPLIRWFVGNVNHSNYKTTPLQEALQTAFTEDQYLFKSQRLDQNWTSPVKVAVTTTSSSSSPVVLANYNRRCEEKLASGRLYCRFADGSLEMQELGKLIRTQSYQDKNPFFLVREKGMHNKSKQRELSPDIVGSMINQGKFPMRKMNIQLRNKLPDVEIYLFLNDAQHHSISGFPHCLFNDENEKANSVVKPPPPYISGRQLILPGDTESEKAADLRHAFARSSPAATPPPAYNNNTRHSEEYVAYRLGPDVVRGDAARPRSEPRVLTEEQVRWQRATRSVVPLRESQPGTTAAISGSGEQEIAEATSIAPSPIPSPEIVPVQRVPSLPHTLPPLDAFEPVSFSITMDGSAPTDGPASFSNDPGTNNQWRWDIQF
ncbi:hypothetical protein N0V94_002998 [Neodidymelliopsis sp. IMI 364377]|nr:hypothetical protein N0V94_002998 [Neodidymelliopsis sp. IMI 364377]